MNRRENTFGSLRAKKLARLWAGTSVIGSVAVWMATAPLSPALLAATAPVASLGRVTGIGTLAQNGTHLPLSGGILPVANRARLETAEGSVRVDLLNGGSLVLGPYGSMTVEKTQSGVVAKVESGLVRFHLPTGSQVTFQAEKFQASSTGREPCSGEILLGPFGNTAIFMNKGSLPVTDLATHKVTLATAGNPVDVGTGAIAKIKRTPMPAGLAEGDADLPAGAKPIYGMNGQSFGYIPKEGGFALQKGAVPPINKTFTTSDIPADAGQPQGGMGGWSKGGKYQGYLYQNVWYPYGHKGAGGVPWWVWAVTLAVVGAGVGSAAAFTSEPSAAPVTSVSP